MCFILFLFLGFGQGVGVYSGVCFGARRGFVFGMVGAYSELKAEALLKEAAPVVADWNTVKAGVAVTMLAACKLAASHGVRLLLSGLGALRARLG